MVALTAVGLLVGVFALSFVSALLDGYVLTILWTWFVVPTFGLRPLALVPAIGFSMVVSFLTPQMPKGEVEWGDEIGKMFLRPAVMLFFAWIVHLFM